MTESGYPACVECDGEGSFQTYKTPSRRLACTTCEGTGESLPPSGRSLPVPWWPAWDLDTHEGARAWLAHPAAALPARYGRRETFEWGRLGRYSLRLWIEASFLCSRDVRPFDPGVPAATDACARPWCQHCDGTGQADGGECFVCLGGAEQMDHRCDGSCERSGGG